MNTATFDLVGGPRDGLTIALPLDEHGAPRQQMRFPYPARCVTLTDLHDLAVEPTCVPVRVSIYVLARRTDGTFAYRWDGDQ